MWEPPTDEEMAAHGGIRVSSQGSSRRDASFRPFGSGYSRLFQARPAGAACPRQYTACRCSIVHGLTGKL